MRKLKPEVVLFFLLFFTLSSLPAQEYRLGGSAIYNFKTAGIGLGLRAEFPVQRVELLEGLSIVPQISYFPSFNKGADFYVGSSVHLGVYKYRKWIIYTLINASYRSWHNKAGSDDNTDYANVAVEGGIGVARHTCIRPFFEFRLNVIGVEPNVRVGVLYTFHCDIRGAVPCPKIPAQPMFD